MELHRGTEIICKDNSMITGSFIVDKAYTINEITQKAKKPIYHLSDEMGNDVVFNEFQIRFFFTM